jgi:2'-hydroxyisoflavone reductase
MTDAALAAGHHTTVLSRGQTHRTSPRDVEHLKADRLRDLSVLKGRSYDLVIDTCAFTPDAVSALFDTMASQVGRYALVSSISVYDALTAPGSTEAERASGASAEHVAHVASLPLSDRCSAEALGGAYGPMKRECELVALNRLADAALILRVGLLVGAGDYTDRLTSWVRRIDLGGTIVCPGDPNRPVQVIDVRDVARWTLDAAVRSVGGVFNVTARTVRFIDLLEACRTVSGSTTTLAWVPEEIILRKGIRPWTDLPLWLPSDHPRLSHILDVSVEKAFSAGLTTRPLTETISAVLAWDRQRRDQPLKAGLSPEQEQSILA